MLPNSKSATTRQRRLPERPISEVMAHRLETKAGRDLYAQRKQTIEPVFCIIKSAMGFRQFGLRGKSKASLEWTLVTLSYNLKRPGQSPRKNRVAGRRRPLS